MTPSDKSYSAAAADGRRARDLLIGLTHKLPKSASKDLLRKWNDADTALLAFLRQLDDEEGRFDDEGAH